MGLNTRASSMSSVKRWVVYWLPVVAICAVIFVQSSYPSPDILPTFSFSDKVVHAVVYGLLAACLARAFNSHERWRHRHTALWLLSMVVATVYGLSDEWHQSFVDTRSADVLDGVADAIGAFVGAWLYVRLVLSSKTSPQH